MLSPADWTLALAPSVHWRTAYAIVEREARSTLRGTGTVYSTMGLVEALWPARMAVGAVAGDARKRLIRGLMEMAKPGRSMADCARKGPRVQRRRFGSVAPWEWSLAEPAHIHGKSVITDPGNTNPPRCLTCGGRLK